MIKHTQQFRKSLYLVAGICIVAIALLIPSTKAFAGRDLGCYNNVFLLEVIGDGTLYEWNGNVQLGRGSRTEPVRNVQQFLVYTFGKDLGSFGFRSDGVDGAFGNRTYRAVKEVQRSYRNRGFTACGRPISVDGVVGPQTWAIFFSR